MNIVFLNLADNDPQGITAKSVRALKTKFPPVTGLAWWIYGDNTITEYNLIPLLTGGQPKLGTADVTLATVGSHCKSANKVMIAIHGNYDNRDRGVVTMGFGVEEKQTVSLDRLCDIVTPLLPGAGEYNLTLVMCYGARTVTYRLDHFTEAVDWSSSFAYRFYERIRVGKSLRLIAFTGAVSVDEITGRFKIQAEAAIGAEIDLKENEAAYLKSTNDFNDLIQESTKAESDEYFKKYDVLTAANPRANPSTDPKYDAGYVIVAAYAKCINQYSLKQRKTDVGKIYFLHPNETTIVFAKQPKLRILYPARLATRR
jgi:hypothetical protein